MSFQPFSPWTPPTKSTPSSLSAAPNHTRPIGPSGQSGNSLRQTTPPSGPGTPMVATPNLPSEPGLWSERYKSLSTGNVPLLGMTPLPEPIQRRPLADIAQNTVSPQALASPFMPGINNGAWGPPGPSRPLSKRPLSVEERLALAEAKIRELTLENNRLRERQALATHITPSIYASPAISTASSVIFDNQNPTHNRPGFGAYGMPKFEDPVSDVWNEPFKPFFPLDEPEERIPPSPLLITAILQGRYNFSDMSVNRIRSIVWIVANHQPKSNGESSGLKAAVNALASRLGLPRSSAPAEVLVRAIIEWAKPLCFTSCGNYLCQQLLERGDNDDKNAFIEEIKEDIVPIASDKFGTHVLCKAITIKELEEPISQALISFGIFDSMKTGARRLWREYLEKCRQAKQLDIFEKINEEMIGRWTDLACINEHGSIAVQQVFEVYGSQELMMPCFKEILADIARVANNQFGHFVITKLIGYTNHYRPTCDAILTSYPPVATTHHGVNFAKVALTEGGRGSIVKYVDAICSSEDGRTPGIVAIATSSIGKAHLTFVLSCLTPGEHVRVRQTCRAFSTTLRNSQSGNDLLRSLGLMHAVGARHRAGSN